MTAMKTSPQGKAEILAIEQFREYAYPDPLSPLAKATRGKPWGFKTAVSILATVPEHLRALDGTPWTCGIGQTQGVTPNTRMSKGQALADLDISLPRYEQMVLSACTLPPTQPQFDALVCLAWNCPSAVLPSSSIIKAHNRGDTQAAAKAFELYNKSRGVPSTALLTRRKREATLYLQSDSMALSTLDLSPQQVDPEKPLTRSKINIASATAGTVASVSAASEALRAFSDLRDGIASLGTWLLPLGLLSIVGLCGFIVWQRYDLRRRGVV